MELWATYKRKQTKIKATEQEREMGTIGASTEKAHLPGPNKFQGRDPKFAHHILKDKDKPMALWRNDPTDNETLGLNSS